MKSLYLPTSKLTVLFTFGSCISASLPLYNLHDVTTQALLVRSADPLSPGDESNFFSSTLEKKNPPSEPRGKQL